MSPGIDTNDLNTKVKNAMKFLNDGNRVKVSVRFRGREMAHTNIGEKLLMDFAAAGGFPWPFSPWHCESSNRSRPACEFDSLHLDTVQAFVSSISRFSIALARFSRVVTQERRMPRISPIS